MWILEALQPFLYIPPPPYFVHINLFLQMARGNAAVLRKKLICGVFLANRYNKVRFAKRKPAVCVLSAICYTLMVILLYCTGNTWEFCTAGRDQYIRIFDRRALLSQSNSVSSHSPTVLCNPIVKLTRNSKINSFSFLLINSTYVSYTFISLLGSVEYLTCFSPKTGIEVNEIELWI